MDGEVLEQVYVVRRADWNEGRWPHGFVRLEADLLLHLERLGSFVPRDLAERTPDWKQLIPYCVVLREGAILCVQRHRQQSESRLHDLLSIGLGGHVGPDDRGPGGLLRRALARELEEELVLPDGAARRASFLGLLNDESTEVGQVHVGLVFALRLGGGERAGIRERTKMSGGFQPLAELYPVAGGPVVGSPKAWQDPRRFESWSRILLEAVPWRATGPQSDPHHRSEDGTDG